MRLLAIMDWQHVGKPAKIGDRGAVADLDGDGELERLETEAAVVGRYWLEAQFWAIDNEKTDVIPVCDGDYMDRHARACDYARRWRSRSSAAGRVAYVACHANAGGGDYGAVFHDARSRYGRALAEDLAAELGELEELRGKVRVLEAEAGSRAYNTIAGVYSGAPVGVCLEPGFLDTAAHRRLWRPEGAADLGRAIARGLDRWRRRPS